jgi:hypothetical protein
LLLLEEDVEHVVAALMALVEELAAVLADAVDVEEDLAFFKNELGLRQSSCDESAAASHLPT